MNSRVVNLFYARVIYIERKRREEIENRNWIEFNRMISESRINIISCTKQKTKWEKKEKQW